MVTVVHEVKLSAVLAEFARNLTTDFPIQSILDHLVGRIVEVLPISAAGVTLIAPDKAPRYIAASDDNALLFERLQVDLGQGPCVLAFETGEPVVVADLRTDDRFAAFAAAGVEAGMAAVFALPLRHGDEQLGALDLYRQELGPLDPGDMAVAQTLADVTTAYLLNAQAREDARATSDVLRDNAHHDHLTGLPNRQLFQERLDHAIARSRRNPMNGAVLFVDLDNFKLVNDTYGHQIGDDMLVEVGRRLADLVRPGDTLARFSGDEFVFLCEDVHSEGDARRLAKRIDTAFEYPFPVRGVTVPMTASVGIAFAGLEGGVTADLVHKADVAMYQAKRQGAGGHQLFDLRDGELAGDPGRLERTPGSTGRTRTAVDTGDKTTEDLFSGLLSDFARTLLTKFDARTVLTNLMVRIGDVLPGSSAGATLRPVDGEAPYVVASSPKALKLQEHQNECGEGPGRLTLETGDAVAVADLRADLTMERFAAEALDSGFAAAFSFPLCDGKTLFGVLDLYRAIPGALSTRETQIAQTLADVAAAVVLNATARDDLLDAATAARQSTAKHEQGARALRASVLGAAKAGQALDVSEARNQAILASALDAVITIDADGLIVEFNASAERMFGHSQAVLGRDLAEVVIPPSKRETHRRGIARYLATGDSTFLGKRLEMTAMRADGSLFPAEISIHAVGGPGATFFTGFVRDLSDRALAEAERRALEEQLHQKQRLESLGHLAGGVAHDFNNLLTIMLGYSDAILEVVPGNTEVAAHVEQILEAGARAARVTSQLLTFAQRQPVHYESLDLNEVVDEIRTMLSKTIGDNVRLVTHLTPDLPRIHADRGQTDQVLLNLAVNARHAMAHGGTLTIETALGADDDSHLGIDAANGSVRYVQLLVRDTGVGMSADVAAHAFDPFFTTRAPGEGSGLGLATVHGIMAELGGRVVIDSEVGVGTVVRALFPVDLTVPAPAPPKPTGRVSEASGVGTILVIDDEPGVLSVVALMLRTHGYDVLESNSAADALTITSKRRVDLVLTDVLLPDTSGFALADELHSDDSSLPVLFMSGDMGRHLQTSHPKDLGKTLLQKPFQEATLLRSVATALSAAHPSVTDSPTEPRPTETE